MCCRLDGPASLGFGFRKIEVFFVFDYFSFLERFVEFDFDFDYVGVGCRFIFFVFEDCFDYLSFLGRFVGFVGFFGFENRFFLDFGFFCFFEVFFGHVVFEDGYWLKHGYLFAFCGVLFGLSRSLFGEGGSLLGLCQFLGAGCF